jgi:vitamin B12 transporter
MRKTFITWIGLILTFTVQAQDTLKTTTLQEVVVTGTKFGVDVEKSGKTITRITSDQIEKNAGKNLGDILNEVPGLQVDGNFGTPGSNIGYYLRGGRNRHTLILIDGVPFTDPSAISAEYDLRYIPLQQIESIEILRGGLSTLYGTGAAAGVINIKLREPASKRISGVADVSLGSFNTFSQNFQVGTSRDKWSFFVSGNDLTSKGFSSAEDRDETIDFDDDGFNRQNTLLKIGFKPVSDLNIQFHTAYERFEADYDAFEFTDAEYRQEFDQIRIGLTTDYIKAGHQLTGKIFYNVNDREFFGDYPSTLDGGNLQADIIHRYKLSDKVQSLSGLNYQRFDFGEKGLVSDDTANFNMIDPYVSLLVDLPVGFSLHAGARLNYHSTYGSKFIYNINPSFLFNSDQEWRPKVYASVSTSYVTPSLYHLYSFYGNKDLNPEEALNYELGISIYNKEKFTFNATGFKRLETDPIDFVSEFDDEGNYVGGHYQNVAAERAVSGVEFSSEFKTSNRVTLGANYTYLETDKPTTFYRIPTHKYGISVTAVPVKALNVNLKYNHTGAREIFDFVSFSEAELSAFDVCDLFVSYKTVTNFTIYAAVNNFLDEKYIAVYGYTTRGRNFSGGLRYEF